MGKKLKKMASLIDAIAKPIDERTGGWGKLLQTTIATAERQCNTFVETDSIEVPKIDPAELTGTPWVVEIELHDYMVSNPYGPGGSIALVAKNPGRQGGFLRKPLLQYSPGEWLIEGDVVERLIEFKGENEGNREYYIILEFDVDHLTLRAVSPVELDVANGLSLDDYRLLDLLEQSANFP